MTKICVVCGKEFEPYNALQKACSQDCRDIMRQKYEYTSYAEMKAGITKGMRVCVICGKEFPPHGVKKTCSPECSIINARQRDALKRDDYRAATAARKAAMKTTSFRRECVRNSRQALTEDCKAAKAAGLSYGQWRARECVR